MSKKSFLASVALLTVASPAIAQAPDDQTLYPGGHWEPGPARYGSVNGEVSIPMDDGVILQASVAWPTDPKTGKRASGTFPVVIEHQPYTHLAVPTAPLSFFPEHGYIYLLVHSRGTGQSGGEIQYVSPRDGEDGRAIVDWAATKLDGSDGRLALFGCSFPGGTALMDAAHLDAGSPVKAIVAACNGFNSQNRGSFMRSGMDTGNVPTMASAMPDLVGNTPSAKAFFPRVAHEIEAGGDAAYDRDFWQQRLVTKLAEPIVKSGIPILLWSGWRDHVDGPLRTWTALQNVAAGRPAGAPMTQQQMPTPRYQLVMTDQAHAQGLDLGIFLECENGGAIFVHASGGIVPLRAA